MLVANQQLCHCCLTLALCPNNVSNFVFIHNFHDATGTPFHVCPPIFVILGDYRKFATRGWTVAYLT